MTDNTTPDAMLNHVIGMIVDSYLVRGVSMEDALADAPQEIRDDATAVADFKRVWIERANTDGPLLGPAARIASATTPEYAAKTAAAAIKEGMTLEALVKRAAEKGVSADSIGVIALSYSAMKDRAWSTKFLKEYK